MPTQTSFLCPTCGTHYGQGGCPHAPPGGGRATATGTAPPAAPAPPPTPSGKVVVPPRDAPAPAKAAAPAARSDPGIYIGADVVPSGGVRISGLGYQRSGKTTYLGMLYFLLTTGRLPGYRFSWSDSLRDLETIRSQLHRTPRAGGPTFPPRTDTAKTVFIHLGLRRWDDARYVDLFFPEFSGEDVDRIWTDGAFPENLHFLKDFNGYIVFVDATATSPLDSGKYLRLVSGLLELKGVQRLKDPVAVVLSKWDLVAGEEGAENPEEFFKNRFGGLYNAWRGQIESFRIFPVSAVGNVRTVLGPDGLPIKRDGAVMFVPSPDRVAGDEAEEEPSFNYRPFNLSRPLLWLLDKLMLERTA